MVSDAPFADHYPAARRNFRAAASAAGARLESHAHPLSPAAGGPLAIDVAHLGPAEAERVLLVVSGTGGIEGVAGSALQSAWLRAGTPDLPRGCRLMLVHALNPYGFANSCRVAEDNVDLDRNFLDFTTPPPDNPGYEALAGSLAPTEWDELGEQVNRRVWAGFIARHGERAFLDGVSGGQYGHPEGIYFGGRAPTWSHRTLAALLAQALPAAGRLGLVDLRTGPGAAGAAEVICRHAPDGPAFARAVAWFGRPVHAPARGDTLAPVATGTLVAAPARWLPQAEVTAVAVRFGTCPEDKVFEAVRADNWLRHFGDAASPRGRAIKAMLGEAFAPAGRDWRDSVLGQGRRLLDRALRGLAAG